MTPAGLEPAIPGSVGRCLIHWATGPIDIAKATDAHTLSMFGRAPPEGAQNTNGALCRQSRREANPKFGPAGLALGRAACEAWPRIQFKILGWRFWAAAAPAAEAAQPQPHSSRCIWEGCVCFSVCVCVGWLVVWLVCVCVWVWLWVVGLVVGVGVGVVCACLPAWSLPGEARAPVSADASCGMDMRMEQ